MKSIRLKLIVYFLAVSFIVEVISLFIGGHLLYNAVIRGVTEQVRLALNAAGEVYRSNINYVKVASNTTTLGIGFRTSFKERNIPDLIDRLERITRHVQLDFAGIASEDGQTLCRIGPNALPDMPAANENPIAALVIETRQQVAGTVVLPKTFLLRENPELYNQIQFSPPSGDKRDSTSADGPQCLAISAGIPIFENRDGGKLLGVLYCGIVLNQSPEIVDVLRKSAFPDETMSADSLPTATIFHNEVRIATNMKGRRGQRAIGTLAPAEVKDHVLAGGSQLITRHFCLTDRYIAAYRPIEDIFGKRVGMLSIAILESNYSALQKTFVFYFAVAVLTGAFIAIFMGYFLANRIMAPVHRLIKASQAVSEEDYHIDIGPLSKDIEMAVLQETFLNMVNTVKKRRLESQSKIFKSEKQASIGRLSAGVAHEINNPLTGVLTYTHMLLRRRDLSQEIRSDLEVIAESTERVRKIVKGLLDFSRQTKLDPEPTDINRLMRTTINLVENQALLKGVEILFTQAENLPMLVLDRSQVKSVFLNILINALDATRPSDRITVNTATTLSAENTDVMGIEITIADTGCGIPSENLNKIFDPFFTNKEVGEGTGLGLSVSFGIIREHKGTIKVKSEVGKGTTFFIWLPMKKEET